MFFGNSGGAISIGSHRRDVWVSGKDLRDCSLKYSGNGRAYAASLCERSDDLVVL
jgi:hypothetical protein